MVGADFKNAWDKLPYDVQLEITSYLTLRELAAAAKSESYGQRARQAMKERVDAAMVLLGLPPTETQTLMRETNTILSGSAALAIATNASWEPGDADWYCPVDKQKQVLNFFLAHGFVIAIEETNEEEALDDDLTTDGLIQVQPTQEAENDNGLDVPDDSSVVSDDSNADDGQSEDLEPYGHNHAIKKVFTLYNAGCDVKMNLIVSLSQSPYAPILFFHSTVVMNVVAGDGVASFYPRLTFSMQGLRNVGSLATDKAREKTEAALAKYRDRGYRIVSSCKACPNGRVHTSHVGYCQRLPRSIDDAHTLRLSFRKDQPMKMEPPTMWMLGGAPRPDDPSLTVEPIVQVKETVTKVFLNGMVPTQIPPTYTIDI